MKAHPFITDGVRDALGYTRCRVCELPKRNAVHDVEPRDPDEAVVAARIIGEGTRSDDR